MTRSVPHCLCIAVEVGFACVWLDMVRPRVVRIRAGTGLVDVV